jgi:hypothetical protein
MKYLIMLIMLTGCGITEQMNRHCNGSDLELACETFFGNNDKEQDIRLDELEQVVSELASKLDASILELQQADSANQSTIQSKVNSLTTQLAVLQTNNTVTELIDPCGDGAGYDEVLLRTSKGDIVAYFESGSARRLSVLKPGSYATTDGTGCAFTVNSEMKVCDGLGCR